MLLLPLIVGAGALVAISHQDVVGKAAAAHANSGAPSARFSRFKVTDRHMLSIFWKLHFEKQNSRAASVAVWHLRPFGEVDLEGAKR